MVSEKELADLKYGIKEVSEETLRDWYNAPDLQDVQFNRIVQAELIRRGVLPDASI